MAKVALFTVLAFVFLVNIAQVIFKRRILRTREISFLFKLTKYDFIFTKDFIMFFFLQVPTSAPRTTGDATSCASTAGALGELAPALTGTWQRMGSAASGTRVTCCTREGQY